MLYVALEIKHLTNKTEPSHEYLGGETDCDPTQITQVKENEE